MRMIDADALKYRHKDYGGYDDVSDEKRKRGILFLLEEDIAAAPTIEPKKGKWITMSDADGVYWACSECGEDIPRVVTQYDPRFNAYPRLESINPTAYCPHCGVKMDAKEV